jgi:hypothetical protein
MTLPKLSRRSRAAPILLAGLLALVLLAGPVAAEIAAAPRDGQGLLGPDPARAARIRQVIADPERDCLPATAAAAEGAGARAAIAAAVRALRISAVGAWLLDHAAGQGVLICLDAKTALAAYYRSQLRLIGVQAGLPQAAKTLFLAHELAHVPQHPSYSNNRYFPVDDLILMHRMREASAEAVATRVLWQMHRRGASSAWRAKLETGYGDIARAFAEAVADAAAGGAAELRAARTAFDQWFAWPLRLQQYDSHMLDHVERIARDRHGLVRPQRTLTDRFLRGLGDHAGESFLAGVAVRSLTGAHYRGGLSEDNAARLAVVTQIGAGRLAGASAALPAAGGALRN